jgi:hypothetical protein
MKFLKTPFLRKFLKDESGQSVAVILVSIGAFMALAASGVETGHVYYAYRMLQASTNAATLAAAQAMPDIGTASAATAGTAWGNLIAYSSENGQKNANPILSNDSISASFYCSSTVSGSLNVSCQSPPSGEGSCTTGTTCNALAVTQTAQVNLWFGGFVGIRTFNLSANSTAAMRGGSDIPYNIAIVLDTTSSMNDTASSGDGCGTGATQITCAVDGIKTLLQLMDPCALNTTCSSTGAYVDDVSLFAFPPMNISNVSSTTGNVTDDTTCPTSNPSIVPYSFPNVTTGSSQNLVLPNSATTYPDTAGTYQVVVFSNTYKANDETTTLSTSDALSIAAGAGGGSCKGVQAPGGDGTYYAQAIVAAQSALVAQQAAHPGSQNIMIILSDGDASACNSQAYTTGGGNSTCTNSASQIVAVNCPAVTSTTSHGVTTVTCGSTTIADGSTHVTLNCPTAGCTGSPLNGTGTSTTNPNGYESATYPSELGQCGQAVWAAQNATAAGTKVYTVAMGSETSGGCTTDQHYTITNLSNGAETWPSGTYSGQPCNAIAAMASTANTFYSDATGGCKATNNSAFTTMSSIFQAIGDGLTSARLIPNGTT